MEKINYYAMLRNVNRLMKQYMPNHAYHNKVHGHDVFYAGNRLAKLERVSYEDRFELATAFLIHDLVVVIGAKDNEEKSIALARPYLIEFGYTLPQIDRISDYVMATKMPTKPNNHLEMIICDADADNLGRDDCIDKGLAIMQELGMTDEKKWYGMQAKFLANHKYYTASAQRLRGEGLKQNMKKLEGLLAGTA